MAVQKETKVTVQYVPVKYGYYSTVVLRMSPECADGSQVLLPRALCSVTTPATTFPRLQVPKFRVKLAANISLIIQEIKIMRPRPTRQLEVPTHNLKPAVKMMFQVTQIVRFLIKRGLRFRNLTGRLTSESVGLVPVFADVVHSRTTHAPRMICNHTTAVV